MNKPGLLATVEWFLPHYKHREMMDKLWHADFKYKAKIQGKTRASKEGTQM